MNNKTSAPPSTHVGLSQSMTTLEWIIIILSAALTIVSSWFFFSSSFEDLEAVLNKNRLPIATLVEGERTIKHKSTGLPFWKDASGSMSLYEKDKLYTYSSARASLRFLKGETLDIGHWTLERIHFCNSQTGKTKTPLILREG